MATGDYYTYLLTAVRENVLPLTSGCNLGCIFCSHRQNPASVFTFRLPHLPVETVLELAQFLDPAHKVVIGESATRLDEGEPFTHPQVLEILRRLRRQLPDTLISITTNGTLLTPDVISALAALAPLEITLSLNSATPAGRRVLLQDPEPGRALAAVRELDRQGLIFHGSLVAMPHITGWEDMEKTVCFLADEGARTIRVFLPGYTANAPADLQFPLSLWDEVAGRARYWTDTLGVPVIPEPSVPQTLTPDIWGVMRNSPASRAGLLPGDTILAVNGRPAHTRVEAFQLCKGAVNPHIVLKRQAQRLEVTLEKERGDVPGFVALYDFDPLRVGLLARELAHHRSVAPLVLASEFGYPILRLALEALMPAQHMTAIPVHNRFFGGSIRAAGLLTVEDFSQAARTVMLRDCFDLILVPREAFDHKQLDLTGRHIDELSRALARPVCAV